MVSSISSSNVQALYSSISYEKEGQRLTAQSLSVSAKHDSVKFGQGAPLSHDQSMGVVLERAMEKLRGVVDDARAELGIPEGALLDTSPEATANRIADFALGAFDAFHRNHEELGEDEARQQFADFIGGAIQQGISEARDILTALSSLSDDVNNDIDATFEFIQARLDDFVANGSGGNS